MNPFATTHKTNWYTKLVELIEAREANNIVRVQELEQELEGFDVNKAIQVMKNAE